MSEPNPSDPENTTLDVAFGRVVTVRPVPTRCVTQIIIEMPDNCHVQATSLLFNQDAFVIAGKPGPGTAYGVVPLQMGSMTVNDESQAAPKAQPAARAHTGVRVKLGGLTQTVDPSKWLGIQCQTVQFMDWLGKRSAQEAAEEVRKICGVESRRDIADNASALDAFMNKIYKPFLDKVRADERALKELTDASNSAPRSRFERQR